MSAEAAQAFGSVSMKPREPRRKVLIRARMNTGGLWSDVCIVNVSTRGLGLQTSRPPPAGTFIEVRPGRQVIVAKVVWSNGHRFGVRTQDPLLVAAIVAGDAQSRDDTAQPWVYQTERRRIQLSHEQRHQQSKYVSQAMQFACLCVLCASAALVAFAAIQEALAEPLSHIRAALSGNEEQERSR